MRVPLAGVCQWIKDPQVQEHHDFFFFQCFNTFSVAISPCHFPETYEERKCNPDVAGQRPKK